MDACVYCGGPRECLDHNPPISKLDCIDVTKALKKGMKFELYPSCLECNARLSNKISIDLLDRMNTIAMIYLNKADKVEKWTPEELQELGPNLRSLIENSSDRATLFALKAKKIFDRIDELQGINAND